MLVRRETDRHRADRLRPPACATDPENPPPAPTVWARLAAMKATTSKASATESTGASNVVPNGMLAWTNCAAVIARAMPAPSLKLSGPHSGG